MRKAVIDLAASILLVALLAHNAEARQPIKTARIGLLGGMSAATFRDRLDVFRQQLRDLGYLKGKNLVFEEHSAIGVTIPPNVLARADRVIK